MKFFHKYILSTLLLGLIVLGSPLALAKDKVVLSFQQNPASEGLEAACVVLQLGTGLLKSGKAKVTVFATLDGIYIADIKTYSDDPICDTLSPETGPGEAPLWDVLFGFLNNGGEVLLCPLCNYVRQPYTAIDDERIYSASPIPLLLEAKKVIDY